MRMGIVGPPRPVAAGMAVKSGRIMKLKLGQFEEKWKPERKACSVGNSHDLIIQNSSPGVIGWPPPRSTLKNCTLGRDRANTIRGDYRRLSAGRVQLSLRKSVPAGGSTNTAGKRRFRCRAR